MLAFRAGDVPAFAEDRRCRVSLYTDGQLP